MTLRLTDFKHNNCRQFIFIFIAKSSQPLPITGTSLLDSNKVNYMIYRYNQWEYLLEVVELFSFAYISKRKSCTCFILEIFIIILPLNGRGRKFAKSIFNKFFNFNLLKQKLTEQRTFLITKAKLAIWKKKCNSTGY